MRPPVDRVRARSRRLKRMAVQWLHFMDEFACLMLDYSRKFLHKVPCYTSSLAGEAWMKELMEAESSVRCIQSFRMEPHVLKRLCEVLSDDHGLKASRNMSVLEKVGIFLNIISLGMSNREGCERFQQSGDTISRTFHEVLDAFTGRRMDWNGLNRKLIRPHDPTFSSIPKHIRNDNRFKLFKGAIGCIDGTHINASIPVDQQIPYRGRKGMCTFNVMAVCDFDMYFTYISAGWEGSAHDSRVFDHAVSTPEMNFPHPPKGKYYLVDKGYPDRDGYMVPYSGVKYHLPEFRTEEPKTVKETFNRSHSSLRNCIERCFGVLKKRWKILHGLPTYSIPTQTDIINTCFALHNWILEHKMLDKYLEEDEEEEEDYDKHGQPISNMTEEGNSSLPNGMKCTRDGIARQLFQMKAWRRTQR